MAKQHYTIVFEHGDRPNQWRASVKELPECHTFGRGLAQTRARIREALILWVGKKASSAELREVLPLPAEAKRVKEAMDALYTKLDQLMKEREDVVAELKNEAWSLRDIAAVLDLSHQRVSQVAERKRRRPRTASSSK